MLYLKDLAMFYKIRDDILFRQYDGHGYIADNSEFGYRFLSDTSSNGREDFVSESAAYMLAALGKRPREIDEVIDDLMRVFDGVERTVLIEDVTEFFQLLVGRGYLSAGETFDTCVDRPWSSSSTGADAGQQAIASAEDCVGTKIGPDDFLRSVHFEIASACNERCVHCYIPHGRKTGTMSPELFYRALEEAQRLNVIHVTLSGGEPLMHEDLVGFLARCREYDMSVNVLSNLTLLTDDVLDEMRRNPLLSVQSSLYSMDAAVHDSITERVGSFAKTKEGILKVAAAGIPVQISCPIMRHNKDCFMDVVSWGKGHDIATAVEPIIFASYDHTGSNLGSRISLDELGDVLDEELSDEGFAASLRAEAQGREAASRDDPICSVCRYSLCVAVNGDVYPCVGWQSDVLGNLNVQTLREVWTGSDEVRRLRGIQRKDFPKCVNCKDRGYCLVCMMCNANESPDGDPFRIRDFQCGAAALTHRKVSETCMAAGTRATSASPRGEASSGSPR